MKIELLIAKVISVGSTYLPPDRRVRFLCFFGGIFCLFLATKSRMKTTGCTLGTRKPQSRSMHENSVVDNILTLLMYQLLRPQTKQELHFLGYRWRFWANVGYLCDQGESWWSEDTILCSEIFNKHALVKVFTTYKQSLVASNREILQLDWALEIGTQKTNPPMNQKGYDDSETTGGNLSVRRI